MTVKSESEVAQSCPTLSDYFWGLQNHCRWSVAVKRREVKGKGEKKRYTHLNAEFQRKARRDKKPSSVINANK